MRVPPIASIKTPKQYGAEVPPVLTWPCNAGGALDQYAVNAFYPTIQGEGGQAGTPMLLLRLQGCPIGCVFCDTPESWKPIGESGLGHGNVKIQTIDDLLQTAMDMRIPKVAWILVTGGEPCWHELSALTNAFGTGGYKLALETSGAFRVTGTWDWICISPKPAGTRPIEFGNLWRANEIKWVVGSQRDIDAFQKFQDRYKSPTANMVRWSVQPMSKGVKATQLCIEACVEYGWHLSIQTHKYLEIA